MCSVARLQVPDDVLMTSTMTSTMMSSYSSFSIASLIGHRQMSGDDTTLVSGGISATETAVRDDAACCAERSEDSLETAQRETTISTSLPTNDARCNCGRLHAPVTLLNAMISLLIITKNSPNVVFHLSVQLTTQNTINIRTHYRCVLYQRMNKKLCYAEKTARNPFIWLYTVGHKKCHFYFYDNFGKCGPISIILSLLDS